ncbi:MAG: type IV pilus assembly protein PilE [Halieaceae bacterium]|jgi:type IV pilus assembly protein PilE
MQEHKGFTLVELMIVVVIVGILAGIALPAYTNFITKARRSDALDALMNLQSLQEKYRGSNPRYAASLTSLGYSGTTSFEGYYTMSIGSTSAIEYTVTAVAVSTKSQKDDTGCTSMSIGVNAANPRGLRSPSYSAGDATNCWQN